MIRFKILLNRFYILAILLAFGLLFVTFAPGVSIAQENYKVVFDETRPFETEGLISETEWYGGSDFAATLRNNGFSVSAISQRPITYEKLREYDVLIMLSVSVGYATSEVDAIKEFVEGGGGLFLAVALWQGNEEWSGQKVAQGFGVSFAKEVLICDPINYYTEAQKQVIKISDIKSHAIMENVSSFYVDQATYITESGSSNVLAYTSGEAWLDSVWDGSTLTWGNQEKDPDEITGSFPVLSEMTYGKGRIVFLGSRGVFVNAWLDVSDNGQLALNIVNWLAELPTTAIFKPPATVTTTTSLAPRIAGIIVTTVLLFAGVIFKIRRDKKRGKPATIKPIEPWKVKALIVGHIIAALWSLMAFILGISSLAPGSTDYDPIAGCMLALTSILFCLITIAMLYNLLMYKKLPTKYPYFNISLCVFAILYSAFLGILFIADWLQITPIALTSSMFVAPLSIPNFISLLIIKTHGTELRMKGEEAKVEGLPKPTTKTLPAELRRDYPASEYIGEGGFAWVFQANCKDGKTVAIKIPKSADTKTGKLFIKEVSNWSTLEHDNIVKLTDFNIFPIPYLEMELCDRSLELGKWSVEEAISIVTDIAKGLKHAHERKIIHGDIKPSNILVRDGKIKISDWGLSKVKSESSTSLSGLTPQYAAPEQISAEFGKADERTDIYQLGTVFYELLTGRPQFEGELSKLLRSIVHDQPIPPSEINPLSRSVEHIIMKCLSKRKEERYQSMDELLKELEDYEPRNRTSYASDENMEIKTLEFKKEEHEQL